MFPEFIRAILAAVAAGIVPGWFWARCLVPTADRAERLTYGIAFSLVFVPAMALIPARHFGQGVSLQVAIFSILTVFVSGLAAYLVFGPAKGQDGPIDTPPSSSGPLTNVLLVFALGVAALAFLGVLKDARVMLPISLLVLFAAAVYIVESPGKMERIELEKNPRGSSVNRWPWVRRLALPVVLLLVLARGYLGPMLYDWPYLRGGDQFNHAVMANMMLTEGSVESYLVYPPGLHALHAVISRLSGLEPVELFPFYAPVLILLPPLALYVLAKRLWGWQYGVAAAAVAGLLFNGTYHYLNYQAMYPTVVSAEFLLVVSVAALVGLYAAPTTRSVLLLALLGSSVALYHPLASLYAGALLGLVGVLILPYLLLRERRTGVALLCSLALTGVLATLYAWDTYDLGRLIAGLLEGSVTTAGGEAVATAIGTQAPLAMSHLLVTITHPVLWMGLFGALILLVKRGSNLPGKLARVTLILWCVILFVGSRTSLSGFPVRFERDLGIPLSLFAVFALGAVLRSPRSRESMVKLSASLAMALVLFLAGYQAVWNMKQAVGPSGWLVLTPEIVAAGEWLKANDEGGKLMISPRGNQVTGRAMLAVSGYTALEAFTEVRIEYNRDLPPYGAGPLRDVLWVLKHPDGERTRKLLAKHDVDYVVFYKNFGEGTTWDASPKLDWREHKAERDLYRVAFENDGVIVLEPRKDQIS